jgi:hypothetical protein
MGEVAVQALRGNGGYDITATNARFFLTYVF